MKTTLDKVLNKQFEIDNKFCSLVESIVINKDILSSVDYMFILRFGIVPSRLYFQALQTREDEFLDFIKEKDFKLFYIQTSSGENTSNNVLFVHPSGVILELNNSWNTQEMGESSEIFGIEISPEKRNDLKISINILFNPNGSLDDYPPSGKKCSYYRIVQFVNELRDKFIFVDNLDKKGQVLLFEKDQYGEMILTPHKVKGYDLDFNKNYNDDFLEVNDRINHWITDFSAKNNKLTLLHGEPGTGKTNYIKYLLNNTSDIKKIYIPPYFVQSISDPSFFPFIKQHTEALLIIEDAEKILVSREADSENSAMSILLNLTDGIMADVLNFKILATFNTDEKHIDDALKRKGRMFIKYDFRKLSEDKTDSLFRELWGEDAIPPEKTMSLSDIYNIEDNNFQRKKPQKPIGFGV